MPKISACLVVYNEEKNIRRCLESIKDAVDEIIIVHDGKCADKTLDICREYTDKIFIRPHIGEAEPHRPFSFKQAAGNWILQIDADEFLSEELKGNIRALTNQNEISGYNFWWRLYDKDKKEYCMNSKIYKPSLYRKEFLFFLGIPHYSLRSRGKTSDSNLILGHLFHKIGLRERMQKMKKWAKIQADYLRKNFPDIDYFQASEADWENAFKNIKRCKSTFFIPAIFLIKIPMGMLKSRLSFLQSFYEAVYLSFLVYFYNKYAK